MVSGGNVVEAGKSGFQILAIFDLQGREMAARTREGEQPNSA